MIRRCDGTDPNLTCDCRDDDTTPWKGSHACDCGRVFDDVDRRTTFPHEPV